MRCSNPALLLVLPLAVACSDYEFISEHSRLIVDTRNAMKGVARTDNVKKA